MRCLKPFSEKAVGSSWLHTLGLQDQVNPFVRAGPCILETYTVCS